VHLKLKLAVKDILTAIFCFILVIESPFPFVGKLVSHQIIIDFSRCFTTFRDCPNNQGLTSSHIASGEMCGTLV
jgi:hypothetical protein